MTFEILILFLLLAAALVLFLLEWLSVDLVTLLLLAALALSGILTAEEVFAGFANEIIIILCSIFVLSAALVKTGVMNWLGQAIHQVVGGNELRILVSVMLLSAVLSAFLSNTTAVAILLPAVLGLSRQSRVSPGRVLIPLAFASMLGGTCTLIGTSTNLAASGMIQKMGMEPFSLFEFVQIGLVLVVIGTLYMAILGRRLLPRTGPATLTEEYRIKEYLSEVVLPEGSTLVGRSLEETPLGDRGVTVLSIQRNDRRIYPGPQRRLREGDRLIVQTTRDGLLYVRETPDLVIQADGPLDDTDLVTDTIQLVEAIIMPRSTLIGHTIRRSKFRQRYGVSVLAVYRQGVSLVEGLANLRFRVGDVILLQGPADRLGPLQEARDLWILEESEHSLLRKRRGIYAVGALGLAVLLGGLQVVPLSIAFLLGALTVVLLQCVTVEEVYSFIEWRLIVLIGGMTAFGLAMQKTQADGYLADLIVQWALPLGLYWVLAGFVVLTMLLTQPMSNAAAVLVVLPVAVATAGQLDINPRSLAVLVTLAASVSLIAPFEPACLLVFGPGKYRFRDFLISGVPLSAIVVVVLLLLVPVLWPL